MTSRLRTDVAVIGGGITGLWVRAALTRAGLGVILVDRGRLGDGQTMRSQGILHRGVKYAFSEAAREASGLLAAAADRWNRALRGEGGIDLRGVTTWSRATSLWSTGTLDSLTAWMASKAMRSDVRELARDAFPEVFGGAPRSVRVWSVDEPVVDPGSLLDRVLSQGTGSILLGEVERLEDRPDRAGVDLVVSAADETAERRVIEAGCVVGAAGEGNAGLLRLWPEGDPEACQVRPLRMAMIDGAPFDLHGHCPRPGSDKPRLTITTGRRPGSLVWYVGGGVAERGATQSPDEFLDSVREEVRLCLPWLEMTGARIGSLLVNRAEGRTPTGDRPDGPVVRAFGRLLLAWPTKLALAPLAADMVLEEVERRVAGSSRIGSIPGLIEATCGDYPWNEVGFQWTAF